MDAAPDISSPSAKPISIASNVLLQPPLSRLGTGPGLILLLPAKYNGQSKQTKRTLDPDPLQKWAEEGFAVVKISFGDGEPPSAASGHHHFLDLDAAIGHALKALLSLRECKPQGKIGVIVYDPDLQFDSSQFKELWQAVWRISGLGAVVSYTGQPSRLAQHNSEAPLMVHYTGDLAGHQPQSTSAFHHYEATSPNFVLPSHDHYEAGAAGVSHTRSVGFLKKHLGGPNFDLEAIWDEHTLFEFGERDVAKTMSTMVEEPYVNHVPTMTGGVGRAALTAFYRDHFIFNNPEDTKLELISRTVGVDRVIDEFIFSFTHDRVVDWLVPGIPPTHKCVCIPFTSIVNIRGDRLYHEHIAWDQATVLRQLGLLPEWLPFPYPLPDGRTPAKGKRFEYRIPAAGVETAMKATDEGSVGSNGLMVGDCIREVDDV